MTDPCDTDDPGCGKKHRNIHLAIGTLFAGLTAFVAVACWAIEAGDSATEAAAEATMEASDVRNALDVHTAAQTVQFESLNSQLGTLRGYHSTLRGDMKDNHADLRNDVKDLRDAIDGLHRSSSAP
jgi:hypothetical protein